MEAAVPGPDFQSEIDLVTGGRFDRGVTVEIELAAHLVTAAGDRDLAFNINRAVVLFDCSPHTFEDLAVLDNVVPVLRRGNIADEAAVVQPD